MDELVIELFVQRERPRHSPGYRACSTTALLAPLTATKRAARCVGRSRSSHPPSNQLSTSPHCFARLTSPSTSGHPIELPLRWRMVPHIEAQLPVGRFRACAGSNSPGRRCKRIAAGPGQLVLSKKEHGDELQLQIPATLPPTPTTLLPPSSLSPANLFLPVPVHHRPATCPLHHQSRIFGLRSRLTGLGRLQDDGADIPRVGSIVDDITTADGPQTLCPIQRELLQEQGTRLSSYLSPTSTPGHQDVIGIVATSSRPPILLLRTLHAFSSTATSPPSVRRVPATAVLVPLRCLCVCGYPTSFRGLPAPQRRWLLQAPRLWTLLCCHSERFASAEAGMGVSRLSSLGLSRLDREVNAYADLSPTTTSTTTCRMSFSVCRSRSSHSPSTSSLHATSKPCPERPPAHAASRRFAGYRRRMLLHGRRVGSVSETRMRGFRADSSRGRFGLAVLGENACPGAAAELLYQHSSTILRHSHLSSPSTSSPTLSASRRHRVGRFARRSRDGIPEGDEAKVDKACLVNDAGFAEHHQYRPAAPVSLVSVCGGTDDVANVGADRISSARHALAIVGRVPSGALRRDSWRSAAGASSILWLLLLAPRSPQSLAKHLFADSWAGSETSSVHK
uniref:Uncharacterized protein n=1 Tax=Mycena chlorophos TaxID=658473 RepID=A0ABQ0KZR2_MYCCL|nr:predicted protein [Mycena chlorophos]